MLEEIDRDAVLSRFREQSGDIDPRIARFVEAKLADAGEAPPA